MTPAETARARPSRLPDEGKFTIDDWCEIFGCSRRTVTDEIKAHSIPVLKCGGTTIIVAEQWWAALAKSQNLTVARSKR